MVGRPMRSGSLLDGHEAKPRQSIQQSREGQPLLYGSRDPNLIKQMTGAPPARLANQGKVPNLNHMKPPVPQPRISTKPVAPVATGAKTFPGLQPTTPAGAQAAKDAQARNSPQDQKTGAIPATNTLATARRGVAGGEQLKKVQKTMGSSDAADLAADIKKRDVSTTQAVNTGRPPAPKKFDKPAVNNATVAGRAPTTKPFGNVPSGKPNASASPPRGTDQTAAQGTMTPERRAQVMGILKSKGITNKDELAAYRSSWKDRFGQNTLVNPGTSKQANAKDASNFATHTSLEKGLNRPTETRKALPSVAKPPTSLVQRQQNKEDARLRPPDNKVTYPFQGEKKPSALSSLATKTFQGLQDKASKVPGVNAFANWASKFERQGEPLRYSGYHAPSGGIMVRGIFYQGGKFIPLDELKKASPEERATLRSKMQASKPAEGNTGTPPTPPAST